MPTSLSDLFSSEANIFLVAAILLGVGWVCVMIKKLVFAIWHRVRGRS